MPAAAPVAGDAIDIQLDLGFSDTVRLGSFAPLTVTLANQGAELTGRLEVVVADGDPALGGRFVTTHTRRVELPGGSRKRFRFSVYFEGFARPLVVRVLAGDQVVAEHSVDLRQRVTTARLLLVLSRDADLDTLNDPRAGKLRVLYPHPDLLPDRWTAYDGVAAVVVHGVSLERLGAGQFAALRKWVTHGGTLAVSGGPDYSLLRTPRLSELLPGIPVGQVQIGHQTDMGAAFATLPVDEAPVDINRVTAFTGTLLLGSRALPLAIERRLGRGKVLYLTFDVAREPFRRWTGMRQLWLDLLRLPPAVSLASQLAAQPTDPALDAFVVDAARPFPGRLALLAFLLLYFGVLALGHRPAASARHARWLAPLATWLMPLLFALCAHLLFAEVLYPRHATAHVAAVIEPHTDGPDADLELQIGWYASHRGDLRLEYEGVEPMFRPLPDSGPAPRPAGDWLSVDPPRGSLQPLSRRGYQLHAVEGSDVIAFDIAAEMTLTSEGPTLIVSNRSGRAVVDAWLVLRGAAYALGTLPAQGEWSRALERLDEAVEFGNEPWFGVLRGAGDGAVDPEAIAARRLALAMFAARREPNPPRDHALLVGQVASPLRLTGASASWRRRELALLRMTLPVPSAEHGRRER